MKILGFGSVTIAAQEVAVPLVVKYLPEFPVWEGIPAYPREIHAVDPLPILIRPVSVS
jgi:hypothetical protein